MSQGFAGPFPVVGTGPACGMPPPPVFGPPPHPQPPMFMKPTGPPGPPTRVPGPCFHCLQMGHLRAQCPARFRGGRPYPLVNSNDCYAECQWGTPYGVSIVLPTRQGIVSTVGHCEGVNNVCNAKSAYVVSTVDNANGVDNVCNANSNFVVSKVGHTKGVDDVCNANSAYAVTTVDNANGVDNVCNANSAYAISVVGNTNGLNTIFNAKGKGDVYKVSSNQSATDCAHTLETVDDEFRVSVVSQPVVQPGGPRMQVGSLSNDTHDGDEGLRKSNTMVEVTEGDMVGPTRFWELEQNSEQIVDVQGRLKGSIEFWRTVLNASNPVIECIEEGYKLPLLSLPPPFIAKNQKSATNNPSFVTEAVAELLRNRCIQTVTQKPHICSPLSVVSNSSGKLRLVLNLRYLNQFLLKAKFKYEDLRVAMSMFQQGDYMFSLDFKSGYHHVDIHRQHWKFLGFSWGQGRKQQFYVLCVLPFGLATACYLFTKLLRPLVRHWRAQGLRAVVYLDDGIVAVSGKKEAQIASVLVQEDLSRAGFVTNHTKCNWTPSQQCAWLGFELDLEQGKITVPQAKINALEALLKDAIGKCSLPAKALASITGKIISMSPGLGPVTRLMTRGLYTLLNTRMSWLQYLPLSDHVRGELGFWYNKIEKFNGHNIWMGPSAVRVVFTDASDSGYAGYTVQHGCHIAQGTWLPDESKRSSTWRELRAVRLVLEALAAKLANERVRWFTDNQNVVRILSVGSKKPDLQNETLAIFSTSLAHCVHVEPEWIPRRDNEVADYLSRLVDYDDWSLGHVSFMELDRVWGPHIVDRFASYYNTQLPRFNSRFWNPGTEDVDAFTCDWQMDNNWLCPPVNLVPRVIRHLLKCKATATLILPEWPSAPFWPMLFPEGGKPASFIAETRTLTPATFTIIPGRRGSSLFVGYPNTNLLALRIP